MKIFLTIAAIMSLVLFVSVMAVEEQTTAAVTVTEFVDTTIGGSIPVNFQSADPGSANNPSNPAANQTPAAVTITIEATTNIITDTFLRGNDWTTPAALAISNVLYDDDQQFFGASDTAIEETVETGLAERNLATSYGAANTGFFENEPCPCGGAAKVRSAFFWLSIPPGQQAGAYTATSIFFKTVKDGVAPS